MEQTGGLNFCNLPPNANIYFGSGGSDGIIAVLTDRVYKYFPVFARPEMDKKQIKTMINYNKYEINVIKELTAKIVKTKLSPHIIEYYAYHKCDKIPRQIFKMCKSYSEYLMDKKNSNTQCKLLNEKGYPRQLISPMYVLEMEKGTNSLENEIEIIAKKKWDKIIDFLNKLFFQVFYTLETIKLIHPSYIHNDLFIRNILTNSIDNPEYVNKYIRYHHKNMTFDLPANGLFIKFNDFGMNQISKSFDKKNNITNSIIEDPYRDYFSIIYDVYNGANLGGKSLTRLIKNEKKLKQTDKYFNQFISVKTINKIIKNNKKGHLDWDWGKTQDPKVVELFQLKPGKKYLMHFTDIFPYDEDHQIVMEFGS